MISCIIVDDEPLALDLLEDNIRQVSYLKLVGKCKNAAEAISLIQTNDIALVFTDIQMPGLDGLQLIETLQDRPMFILHTAFEKFALDGYKLDVVDYLLKPVSIERFFQACNKAHERYKLKNQKEIAGKLPIVDSNTGFIFVNVDHSLIKILLEEIKYIEAQKDYIKIHFAPVSKKALFVRFSLKKIEEILPVDKFLRIHKSYIINMTKVTALRKNSVFIDALEFTVSEQYKDSIDRIINGNTYI
ncbi:MAG: LytTR family DNA-binding domain-containing protein [Chitinophagaceae bacterium]|jgi:DNA-binding LytR/AlgR family response regulator